MVKKLYTRDDSDDEDGDDKKDDDQGKKVSEYNEETNSFLPRNDSETSDMKGDQERLAEEVSKRGVFSYSNLRWYVRLRC